MKEISDVRTFSDVEGSVSPSLDIKIKPMGTFLSIAQMMYSLRYVNPHLSPWRILMEKETVTVVKLQR